MGNGGGFALHEAFSGRVVGVSDPRVVQFPPVGGGEVAVQGGEAPTSTRLVLSPHSAH